MEQNLQPRNSPLHMKLAHTDETIKSTNWEKESLFAKLFWKNWVNIFSRMN